jgi:hypothetical protein
VPADGKPLVLVSFGGFGAALPRLDDPALAAYRFAGFGPKPEGLKAEWHGLDLQPALPHAEAVAACDVLLGKPGYGTFSEAAAHGCRVLFVPRPDYCEARALAAWIGEVCASRELPRADFDAGRWAVPLAALLKENEKPSVPASGGDRIAVQIRKLLSEGTGA